MAKKEDLTLREFVKKEMKDLESHEQGEMIHLSNAVDDFVVKIQAALKSDISDAMKAELKTYLPLL